MIEYICTKIMNGGCVMYSFSYYTPTKVVFGKGTERKVAALIREFGGAAEEQGKEETISEGIG